jgi:hypothetical protein
MLLHDSNVLVVDIQFYVIVSCYIERKKERKGRLLTQMLRETPKPEDASGLG